MWRKNIVIDSALWLDILDVGAVGTAIATTCITRLNAAMSR
jgi:hypothetical protein